MRTKLLVLGMVKNKAASSLAKLSHKNRTKKDYESWWKAGLAARKAKKQQSPKNEAKLPIA